MFLLTMFVYAGLFMTSTKGGVSHRWLPGTRKFILRQKLAVMHGGLRKHGEDERTDTAVDIKFHSTDILFKLQTERRNCMLMHHHCNKEC